jgi:hypothetical protein
LQYGVLPWECCGGEEERDAALAVPTAGMPNILPPVLAFAGIDLNQSALRRSDSVSRDTPGSIYYTGVSRVNRFHQAGCGKSERLQVRPL